MFSKERKKEKSKGKPFRNMKVWESSFPGIPTMYVAKTATW